MYYIRLVNRTTLEVIECTRRAKSYTHARRNILCRMRAYGFLSTGDSYTLEISEVKEG